MGSIVDTSVFIDLERQRRAPGETMPFDRLAVLLGADEEVALAAITASELLHGIHRASPEHRARREAFVESVLSQFPIAEFGILAARAHARLWADLAQAGRDIGAHDRIVAATAISLGWRVATAKAGEFSRIAGLEVVDLSSA